MTIILQWLPLTVLLIDLVIKIIALGTIPRNRRPSSSLAWLLLITITPVFGLILFFLIGSPFVRGRRERVQTQANQAILEHTADLPPTNSELPIGMGSMVRLNRRLSSLPMMTGTSHGLVGDYDASIAAMTTAVREAQRWVHVEIYIMAWAPRAPPAHRRPPLEGLGLSGEVVVEGAKPDVGLARARVNA